MAEHRWQGLSVATGSGQAVGRVRDVWLNPLDHRPEWLVVFRGPGRRARWIPVEGISQVEDTLQTPFDLDQIQAAPRPTPRQGAIDAGETATLRRHYRLKTPRRGAANGRPAQTSDPSGQPGRAGRPAAAGQSDDAMTRSEEQLRLRRSVRPSERVRLVKRIVADEVQLSVKLRREELVLERAPFPPGSAPDMETDGELRGGPEVVGEVVLYEEHPVVSKRVVPKERVRLVKTTVTEEHEVKEQVRKEKIRAERKPQR